MQSRTIGHMQEDSRSQIELALSTRWNASRHSSGEALVEEILSLGFSRIELGYDLRIDLVPGVEKMISSGAVRADSVHNFCPVPVGAPQGHPELFDLASLNPRERLSAVEHTRRTINFAAHIGAHTVVVHAGNVRMQRLTEKLIALSAAGRLFSKTYEKTKLRLQVRREKAAARHIAGLYESIEQLLPVLEETGVRLAIENLPTWEAIPTEVELEDLLKHFNSPSLGYWHDIGHAQVRQNLGFINQFRWLERLRPYLCGLHVHDVRPPAMDHLMPPRGNIDFAPFKTFASLDIPRVLEPAPATPGTDISNARAFLERIWQS